MSGRRRRGMRRRSTKEEQHQVLLGLTRMSVWLHYYYNIYLIQTKYM